MSSCHYIVQDFCLLHARKLAVRMPSHRVLDAPAQVQCSFLELASWLWALAADLQMSLDVCFSMSLVVDRGSARESSQMSTECRPL